MINTNSLFTVKNAGLFLILISLFFSFTNPKEMSNNHFRGKNKYGSAPFFQNNKADHRVETPAESPDQIKKMIISQENQSNKDLAFSNLYETAFSYNSYDNYEGVIGSRDQVNWNDEPSDNIFNINIIGYDKNKSYTLSYSVNGVANSSSVTRSINQSFSLGGYVTVPGTSWININEEIDPSLLKEGNNRILFNSANTGNYYLIRDVRIAENKAAKKHKSSLCRISSNIITDHSIYFKGFTDYNSDIKFIEFNGRKVNLVKNEFEFFGSYDKGSEPLKLKLVKNDGTILEEKISGQEINSVVTVNPLANPEEIIVNKSETGYLLGLRKVDLPPLDASIINISNGYSGYRFVSSAEGKKTIHLPYDKSKVSNGLNESDIAVFKFDYLQKKWLRIDIDSINSEEGFIVFSIDEKEGGDTDYVSGIIKNPESPETASFTPTTTNDIPVANPASKINMINPPAANQQGSANVSYPIEIPAGINGFQPNISVNYNSDAKTGGWAGLGWDIAVETIDIDTRWGVPEFNTTKESEIYMINGEQLVFDDDYLPNKTPSNLWKDRNTSGNRQFYFRTGVKNGLKIIRKGTGIQNYTWEITDEDGNVKVYSDVLKDASNRVVKWFLTSITNKYGQPINYTYDDPSYNLPYNSGKNKYLKTITYSNNTIIKFFNQNGDRIDATSSYKLGVKISDFKLLDKIEIWRANTKIREYAFSYTTGDFGKRLLTEIIQKNGSGEEFNRHSFGYTKIKQASKPPIPGEQEVGIFSQYSQTISSPYDQLSNGSFNGSNMTLIGGNQGKSENWRGAVSIGLSKSLLSWFLPISVEFTKKGTVGFNYSYAENENFGKSQLMDIDGDGLPDKVFYSGGKIKFRKNLGTSFSSETPSEVGGFSGIPLSKNNSYVNTYGLEFSWKNKATGGINYSTTKSNSPVYFSDVNGDGLVDMVYYGKVYFNKIRLNGSNIVNKFAIIEEDPTALTSTPNAILKGINAPITTTPEEESSLLANIVRVWEAPMTGSIDMLSTVIFEQSSSNGKGIEVWAEKGTVTKANENNSSLQSASVIPNSKITLSSQNPQQALNLSNISVEKGQRIYLIASLKEKSAGDKVKVISNINYKNIADQNLNDANGYGFFKFNAQNSYLESSYKGNALGDKGIAKISWGNLSDQTFTDDVDFKIYKLEKKASDTSDVAGTELPKIIFHQKIAKGQSLNKLATDENLIAGINIENLPVNQNSTDNSPTITYLYFDVASDTNIVWDKIKWDPKVTIDTMEEESPEYSMVVQYRTFSEKVLLQDFPPSGNNIPTTDKRRYYPAFASCYDDTISIPVANSDNAEVTFSMKFINYYDNEKNKLYPVYTLKKKVFVQNGMMEIPYIDYYGSATYDKLFYEIHTNNYEVGKYLAVLNPYISILDKNCFLSSSGRKPNYYSARPNTKHYNILLGQMWQGWGGFSYNGTYNNTINQPLKEQDFVPSYAAIENDGYIPEPPCDPQSPQYEDCLLNFIESQKNKRYFTPIELNAAAHHYESPMESALLNKEYMQPYNMMVRKPSETFEGNPIIKTENPLAIIIRSIGWSLNLYGGFGGIGGSGGYSRDNTTEFFQDFNGDGYPDVLVGNQFYGTNITGALTIPKSLASEKKITNETLNGSASISFSHNITSHKLSNNTQIGFSSFGEMVSHMGTSANAAGVSATLAIGGGTSGNKSIWLDMNGDGLLDYISGGKAYINNGKDFIEEDWGDMSNVFKNQTTVVSGGGGVNIGAGSWVLGVGKNYSSSAVSVIFTDMTGDGLIDKLERQGNGHFYLYPNTGAQFGSAFTDLGDIDLGINQQNSAGLNIFGTVCPVIFKVKICASFGGNNDKSTNRQTVDLRDFNGDGLPDILLSTDDQHMTVVANQADKFNLLSTISNPLGGTMYLTYGNKNHQTQQKIGNTYQMPFTKQALVKLEINDNETLHNISGYNKYIPPLYKSYYFEYENGVQDRRERSFLGFGKVTTKDMTGITQVTEYETNYQNVSDFYVPYDSTNVRKYFYKKGLVKAAYTLDSIGRERQRTNYIYRYFDQPATSYTLSENQTEPQFKDIGRIIPLLYKTETIITEYSGATKHEKKVTQIITDYDEYGNVTQYTDQGSTPTNTADDIKVSIAYHPPTFQNVIGIPQEHIVTNFAGTVLRKSQTSIDVNGNIMGIKRFIGSNYAEYNYDYDTYGNLTKSVFPKNPGETESDRMFYQYMFDPTYHTYITKVTDARGYSSSTTYDYLYGVPKTITDINGAVSEYAYDSFGRLIKYRSPADTDWSIKLWYYRDNEYNYNMQYAVTEKKAPVVNGVTPALNYFSSVYVSGWGEEIATKKLFGGTANNYIYTYAQAPLKDIKGRVVKTFVNRLASQEQGNIMDVMKYFSPIETGQMLNEDEFTDYYVTYKYDELDRVVKSTQKGVLLSTGTQDLITQTIYGYDTDRDGRTQFTKKIISPKGAVSITYTDEKGRTTATKQTGDGKNLWTSYKYDLLNQLTEVKDQNAQKTEYTYDDLGRRISEKHPDAGISNYGYDYNSNLISMDNPVLRGLQQSIYYTYKFNRLISIRYPDYEVTYEYGAANAPDHGAGRLVKLKDHSGIQLFKYSVLGQVTENKRFIAAPDTQPKVFKTSYVYDGLNRINKIVYPDGENVYYKYNTFGMLTGISNTTGNSGFQVPFVSDIAYNYNEQMTQVTAGNGTKTEYTYDVWGRLNELALKNTSSGTAIKQSAYSFDADSNIKTISTSVPMSGGAVTGDISIASERTFNYDAFNRLTSSVVTATGKTQRSYYALDMEYNDMHGIASKNSRWKIFTGASPCQNPFPKGNNMSYHYDNAAHPNAVSSVSFGSPAPFTTPWDCGNTQMPAFILKTELYTYDANGNMTKVEESTGSRSSLKRQLFWDPQNRLKGIAESGALHHYVYDADGERALKSEGESRNMGVDGNQQPGIPATVMSPYQYYPNGYMVVGSRLVTKHYYIGSNKIAARVSEIPSHQFLASSNEDLTEISGDLKSEAEYLAQRAGYPAIEWDTPTIPGGIITEQMCEMEVLAQAQAFGTGNKKCYAKLMDGYYAALLNGTICDFWSNFQLDDCMINQPVENLPSQTYWVHPDHLGSSSVITNSLGNTANWYEYMPFGEMLMEQSNNQYNNAFKYNGKELDEATGLYYYGARYYDSKLSIWLSVDPLAIYNPVMETEFYGDGQHNGGVLYSGNLNPYIYTYQNPIAYIDPNGKQTKVTGSKNLLIYILDKNPLSVSHMDAGAKNWDYIGVNSIDQVTDVLQSHYGNNTPNFENLAIKSHGTWGGAKLNPGSSSQEYVFDASKSKGLKYLSEHLSDDANILFTGCNMSMQYLSDNVSQAQIDTYTDLFLKGDRKMFFNGATSGSNIPIMDKNKNIVGETFLFDNDLIKKNGKNYSGFMQFNLNSKGKTVFQNRLYNIRVRSSGGFLRTDFMENKKVIENGTSVIKK